AIAREVENMFWYLRSALGGTQKAWGDAARSLWVARALSHVSVQGVDAHRLKPLGCLPRTDVRGARVAWVAPRSSPSAQHVPAHAHDQCGHDDDEDDANEAAAEPDRDAGAQVTARQVPR